MKHKNKKIGSNTKLILVGCVLSQLAVLSGCASSEPVVEPKKVEVKDEYLTINEGETITEATVKLAGKYNLSMVDWSQQANANLSNDKVFFPLKINVSQLSAQDAFDMLYKQTVYITDIDTNSKIVHVQPFQVSAPNESTTIILPPKPKSKNVTLNPDHPDAIDTSKDALSGNKVNKTQSQLASTNTNSSNQAGSTGVNGSNGNNASDSSLIAGTSGTSINTNSSIKSADTAKTDKPIGNTSANGKAESKVEDSKMAKSKVYTINSRQSYADNLRKGLTEDGYAIYWGDMDDSMAETINEKPENAEDITSKTTFEFVTESLNRLNKQHFDEDEELSVVNDKKLYALVNDKNKYVVFHQNGFATNASVFNVKKGTLSKNVSALAKQFGWTLDESTGWVADEDYMITVDYPLISKNSIADALSKLVSRYPRITPKLLESKREVYILNKSQ
ncbi:hypothetical protein [Vibrio gangliei]|uniref:hypothetical protein n=1 Tax=Vibrio gangliei TaxID=2077090 RepID=UPI000D019B48|nr:hypothetical protein [Vibrio gangliei]